MEKRIFAAIGISIAFLWLWAAVAPRLFPQLARPKPKSAAPVSPAAPPKSVPAPVKQTSAGEDAVAPPTTPVSAQAVAYHVVQTPDYIARFSNRGAQLVSFRLTRYKTKTDEPVELVKARPGWRTDYPFSIESANAALSRRLNSALYAVTDRTERGVRTIEYRYAGDDGVSATKSFRFSGGYLFDVTVNIKPAVPYRVMIGPGIRTLSPQEMKSTVLQIGNGIYQREGDLEIIGRESGDRLQIYENVDYIGIEDNYFLSVMRPVKSGAGILRRVEFRSGPKDVRKELYGGITAAPDGVVAGSAFFGPKETKLLDRYGLAKALQYGMFDVIARFLLEALLFINKYTKNYGFAIVVLTIIIKIVLYPLQHKSIVSMKKMQKVQPKMEAIRNKYKKARTDADQRQKMNVEMMKLYQQEGINPMSGCFPILLQLPILWGFYNLLSRAIELRGAPFILWIHDLSEKDPYYILPILMTATMFIQTYITPATGDPMQRRIFLMMPLVFGWIFKEFPSGLVLYWLVQNVLTITQQMIMNKWWKDHPDELKST
jgi:YidC/Oxa1 family membrane protein insertase